ANRPRASARPRAARPTPGRAWPAPPRGAVPGPRPPTAPRGAPMPVRSPAGWRPVPLRSCLLFSFDAMLERLAKRGALRFVQGPVLPVADQEHVLGARAEGGDARVVDADALLSQHLGDVRKQPGPVGADQAHHRTPAVGAGVEVDLRRHRSEEHTSELASRDNLV